MTLAERFAHYLRYRHEAIYALHAIVVNESRAALQLCKKRPYHLPLLTK